MIRYISESVAQSRYNLRNSPSTAVLGAETSAPCAPIAHYNHLTIFDRTIGFAFQTESANFSHKNRHPCIFIVMNPMIEKTIFLLFYPKTPPFKGVISKSLQNMAHKRHTAPHKAHETNLRRRIMYVMRQLGGLQINIFRI